jgi:hypothetical protein
MACSNDNGTVSPRLRKSSTSRSAAAWKRGVRTAESLPALSSARRNPSRSKPSSPSLSRVPRRRIFISNSQTAAESAIARSSSASSRSFLPLITIYKRPFLTSSTRQFFSRRLAFALGSTSRNRFSESFARAGGFYGKVDWICKHWPTSHY